MSLEHPGIDLGFRPATYFQPIGLEEHLLSRVKGAQRRRALLRLIEEGRIDEIPGFLQCDALSEEDRRMFGRLHPANMGGEYLPDRRAREVEIARIAIASTTGDVTSVYARRCGRRIAYRVVDEYGGDTLSGRSQRTSMRPLTLGELADFFLGAWSLLEVLDVNFEGRPLAARLRFFEGESAWYDDFDLLLRQKVVARFGPDEGDKAPDDADDEDVPTTLSNPEAP